MQPGFLTNSRLLWPKVKQQNCPQSEELYIHTYGRMYVHIGRMKGLSGKLCVYTVHRTASPAPACFRLWFDLPIVERGRPSKGMYGTYILYNICTVIHMYKEVDK
jgi:hypothetical protein